MKGRKIKHSDSLRPYVQSIFISNRQVAFDPSPKLFPVIQAEENVSTKKDCVCELIAKEKQQ